MTGMIGEESEGTQKNITKWMGTFSEGVDRQIKRNGSPETVNSRGEEPGVATKNIPVKRRKRTGGGLSGIGEAEKGQDSGGGGQERGRILKRADAQRTTALARKKEEA